MRDAAAVPRVVLTAEQARHVQGPVNMMLSTCGPLGRPQVTRGIGCRVLPDQRTMSVLVHAAAATRVLEDVRANGRVAVVFTDPPSNRSLQVKSDDARVEPVGAAGAELARIWANGYARRIATLSHPAWTPQNLAAALIPPADDMACIVFQPVAIFDQTPGPAAGQALNASQD